MCVFLDNSRNFIGSENELRRTLEQMDKEKLQSFMQTSGGDWVIWKSSSPYVSHTGGVGNSRSVQLATSFLFWCTTWQITCEKSLSTLIAQSEEILNSRLLTTDNINDPTSSWSLPPSNFLTMKSKIKLQTPGDFLRPDLYSCRKLG